MGDYTLRGPGRDFTPNEATRKRNPHLFTSGKPLIEVLAAETEERRMRQDSKPVLNKLEQRYFDQVLSGPAFASKTVWKQAIRFKLGNGIWYKPDFVVLGDGLTAIEVKGPHAFRGGFENLKVAAAQYPQVKWQLVWQNEHGVWKAQHVLP